MSGERPQDRPQFSSKFLKGEPCDLTSQVYEFGKFRLDTRNRVLRLGTEPVALTPKAFEVLLLLIERRGRVASKDELMQAVWRGSVVEEANLTQTVFMLRKALGETREQRYIMTIQGRGYRFVAEVRDVPCHGGAGGEDLSEAGISATTLPISLSLVTPATSALPNRVWFICGGALLALLIALSAVWVVWPRLQTARPVPGKLMVAVLPFQNLTGDAGQEYFSDGLTEEMITRLGTLEPGHLRVIARTSVMRYKNGQTSLDQIGRELGVQYVVEGSVRRDSNKVRITAQLIQMQDQTHLWAGQYDRELKDLLAVQGEIAEEIGAEIESKLGEPMPKGPAEPALSPRRYAAYDWYLKGQFFLAKRTVPALSHAIEYFQHAIAEDPQDARAYAGLADAYALMGGYSSLPQSEFMSKARAAAMKAVAIGSNLPEAHTALALIVQNNDWDWQTAELEFRAAIRLNPNYATAHHWYAEHLMWRGRFDEALEESERARQLDPLSLIIAADSGAVLYYSRQYDRAIARWRSVLDMDPEFSRAHLIGHAYVEKGMYAEALADTERLRPIIAPPWYWATMAYIRGHSGNSAEARRAFRELLQLTAKQPADAGLIAWACIGIGDKDQALTWLETAYAQHSNQLNTLKVDPAYDSLRDDPRFQSLLHRVGLAR